MLHRFTILVRGVCPRTHRCAVAVAACLLVLATTFYAVERPHIGWGPALAFNPVRMPEEESLSAAPEWLADVAETLVAEGYEHTILQVFSSCPVFGLVKPIDDMWEYHVRG